MGRAYTDAEREELRIKIKKCGKEMFEKDGIKNFRIQKLTKEVKISLGGFYTFFENKEALYREIIDDEKNRIRLKIINWIEDDNVTPKEYFMSIANILPQKTKRNKLYDISKDTPYSLMSELIFDMGKNDKKENLAFFGTLREIWDSKNNKLNKTNEELIAILSILGAISMKYDTMDKEVFERLYKDICMFLIEQIS